MSEQTDRLLNEGIKDTIKDISFTTYNSYHQRDYTLVELDDVFRIIDLEGIEPQDKLKQINKLTQEIQDCSLIHHCYSCNTKLEEIKELSE